MVSKTTVFPASKFGTILLSLICSALVLFVFLFPTLENTWFSQTAQASALTGEACAILAVDISRDSSTDELLDDRQIREMLLSSGLGDFISESSQFVPVDDFGSLKFIPLDSYQNEIEAFDPRDDGYAGRLRSFFYHDGKRFFFKFLDQASSSSMLEKKINSLLKDFSYSFFILGQKESPLIYFGLLIASCLGAFYFSFSKRLFIFQLPLLFALGRFGFFSLPLAAILTAIWELLREPLRELTASSRYERRAFDFIHSGFRGRRERIKPFRKNMLLILFLLILLPVFSIFTPVPLMLLAVVFLAFVFLYCLSLNAEWVLTQKRSHVLFTPVLLLPRKAKTFSFFPLLAPFGIISLLAVFLPKTTQALNASPIDPEYIISAEDYERHIAFQRSFSFRPINQGNTETGYKSYYLGEDGLIAGSDSFNSSALPSNSAGLKDFQEERSFPLAKLMDFLLKYMKPTEGKTALGEKLFFSPMAAKIKEWISIGVILIICAFDFFKPGILQRKKPLAYADKRMAA